MNVDFANALRVRAEGFGLRVDESTSQKLHTYFELLAHWNRRINLTALPLDNYPAATIDRLLLEPLVAAAAIDPEADLNVLDLGSGGGSPVIPLAIARPRLQVTMVESRERKCSFLREADRRLELKGSRVLCARFDDLISHQLEPVDLITLRAVRVDDELNAVIGRLLSSTGRLFVFGAADPKSHGPFILSATHELPGSLHPLAVWERRR